MTGALGPRRDIGLAPAAAADGAWTDLRPAERGSGPPVDVIVPVFAGHRETVTALRRVVEARNRRPHDLIVVDDASPDPAIARDVDALAAAGWATVLRNARNRGFVASANLGLRLHEDRDVVLLNADTEVFDGWLDRLGALATGDVGTVTPFSNDATILSYPTPNAPAGEALELADPELDRLAAGLGEASLEVPTGVGFCLYVTRGCLQATGFLDEETFGRGYGEENDFCRRAARGGWRHLGAGSVFVRHHGGRSFGAEKAARVEAAVAAVERRHPGYRRLVADFVRDDPAAPIRRRLDEARVRRAAPEATLVLGGRPRPGPEPTVRLVRDRGRFWGPFRIRADAAPRTPNLPPVDLAGPIPAVVETLARLGVARIDLRGAGPGLAARRLAAVGRAAGLPVADGSP